MTLIIFNKTPKLVGSPFQVNESSDDHAQTSWRILNPDDSVFWELLNNTSFLTEIIVDASFLPDTEYRAQVRYRGDYAAWSDWSTLITFSLQWIDTPTLTVDQTLGLFLRGTPYLFVGSLADTHRKTVWKVALAATPDTVVYEFAGPDLEEHEIVEVLPAGNYVAWTQYYGIVATSNPSAKVAFTIV